MDDLSLELKNELLSQGAATVGYADLRTLPPERRRDMPAGVSIAVVYPKETIHGITDMPTREYYDQYNLLNKKLDTLATHCADFLRLRGYEAVAQTLAFVDYKDTGSPDESFQSELPHKTAARLAGLGWIGKSALLVTREYGSMIRLTSVLTDAPLQTASTVLISECGDCKICTEACPGGAVRGYNWSPGMTRDEIFDAPVCKKTARERIARSTGITDVTICGKCIAVCPHTRRYIQSDGKL